MSTYVKADLKAMKKLMRKSKDAVMFKKFQSILLHMKGYKTIQIAEIVELDRKTVGRYIRRYKEGGTESLVPKKQTGRPRFMSEQQERELYGTMSLNTPEEVGFDGVKNWTAKIACKWVFKKFGVQYSVSGMLDLFHRLNLSYTRPTYVLAKADPEKQEQFRNEFEGIKKNC